MKKVLILVAILLLFLLSGCANKEDDAYVNNNDFSVEITESKSEKEQLQDLLDVISPITDYKLSGYINDFYRGAISAVLSAQTETVMEQLSMVQNEVNIIVDDIVNANVPEGYAIQDNWSSLSSSCLSLKYNLENVMDAIKDNDSARVFELKEFAGNTGIIEEALIIKNKISAKLYEIQEQESKHNIEVVYSYEECLTKAAKYARYYFENPNITESDLIGNTTPVVIDDIYGKHFAFYLNGNDSVTILINVEDCGIICRQTIPGGYRDNYVNDGVLPAEDSDVAMPDIIGMDFEDAKSILEEMGIVYEYSYIDAGDKLKGTVAYCYPSPGNAIYPNNKVSVSIAS